MTYRAVPITQRDGSDLASSNCRMASIATGIDFETRGATTSTGSAMRARQSDQSGGTDSGDAVQAWRSYSETLAVGDGGTFDDLLDELAAGKLVHVDVWHASVGGPCLSGSGAYGHTMAVAPESSGSRWLVADPWCSPPKWVWVETARLRAGAETWGDKVYTTARATPGWDTGGAAIRAAILRAVVKRLMSANHPGGAEGIDAGDTGGSGGPILFTTTDVAGGSDMAIQAVGGVTSGYTCALSKGEDFYADADLRDRLGELSADAKVRYIGGVIHGVARAILVSTGTAYSDKVARPTIVYIPTAACTPVADPVAPPADPDVDAALAARDDAWSTWLLDGSPAVVDPKEG